MNDYYKYDIERTKEHFKDHEAEFIPLKEDGIYKIKWKKPGSSFYSCNFIIHYGTLFVTGDLGEAIYQWSSFLTPDFFMNLELDYFNGKLRDINGSNRCYEWDKNFAKRYYDSYIEEAIDYYMEESSEYDESLSEEENKKRLTKIYWNEKIEFDSYRWENRKELFEDLKGVSYSQDELVQFARDYEKDLKTLFCQDIWEWIYNSGERVNTRVICHWLGIKMACEQILNNPEEKKKLEALMEKAK